MPSHEHEVGRIDFAGPLEQLLEAGWGFREGARRGEEPGAPWVVFGVQDVSGHAVRGRADARLDAWADAVRLAREADPGCGGPDPTSRGGW